MTVELEVFALGLAFGAVLMAALHVVTGLLIDRASRRPGFDPDALLDDR